MNASWWILCISCLAAREVLLPRHMKMILRPSNLRNFYLALVLCAGSYVCERDGACGAALESG